MASLPLADRPDVVLGGPTPEQAVALAAGEAHDDDAARRAAVAAVVAADPTSLEGWAALARLGREPVERYAYARVGYHRGLDALRANGWGGRGWCRWAHPTNRGFLTCLALLGRAAGEIGEQAEVVRITEFLDMLDDAWDDANVA